MKNINLFLILKGMAMGISEVIPGVSGGTVAFITGIYERLINAIKSFDLTALKLLRKFEFKKFFNHIDFIFLSQVGIGMFLGIAVGVLGVGLLLEKYPPVVWAFFFGLIIASSIYMAKQIDQWKLSYILPLILGGAIAVGVSMLSSAEGSDNLIWVLLSGVIAISALILPGVSGSFILLILGMYTVIRGAAESLMLEKDIQSLSVVVVFCIGCAIGLLSFARVMSYAFKHYKNSTLALLTGFMIGSLPKIWPWRNIKSYIDKDSGMAKTFSGETLDKDAIQILQESLVFPNNYDGNAYLTYCIIFSIIGFILIFAFERLNIIKES